MKRKTKINLLILAWILSLGCATFGIFKFIEFKTERLHSDIRENIMSLFEGQESHDYYYNVLNSGYFDVVFSGFPVKHYKKIPIPKNFAHSGNFPLDKETKQRMSENWKQSYGDISSLYVLNWDDDYPNREDEGWCIVRLYCSGIDDEFLSRSYVFPYQVGMKRGSYASIQQAVNDAYIFFTNNSQSSFAERFRQGSIDELWSKIFDSTNEYFSIIKNNHYGGYMGGTPIPGAKSDNKYSNAPIQNYSAIENGWMHNGWYRVYIASSQEEKFMIHKNEDVINGDRNNLLLWWLIGLSIVFWCFIIPLIIINKKEKKIINESFYKRLCRLCNPKEFVSNYDKDRLNSANDIYKSLMSISEENQQELSVLANRAINELGISIVDESELTEMKEKANPSRYMEPYNPEKVSTANEAYSILCQESMTYEEYKKVKSLLSEL